MSGRVLKTLVTLFVGWILFSMTGTISMKLSFPVPQNLLTHNSHMRYTGATDKNLLEKNMESPYVEPGTLNKLNVFDNGNFANQVYYNQEDKTFCFDSKDGSRWLNETEKEGGLLLAKMPSIGIDSGYYWYFMGENKPGIASERDTFSYAYDWYVPFQKEDQEDVISEEKIAQILEKQMHEKISMNEMAGLLFLHYSEPYKLLGWYPEIHTAVLRMDTSQYIVYQTDTMESQTYSVPAFPFVYSISADELLAYDDVNHSIVIYEISTGKTEIVKEGLEQIETFNYIWSDDQMILGGLETEHKAFLYYVETGQFIEHELGDDFYGESFAFGKEKFIIFDRLEEGGARYKRGAY